MNIHTQIDDARLDALLDQWRNDANTSARLTRELLQEGSTAGCGWNRAQLEYFGIAWPPKRGWRKRITGREYPQETIERFLALKTPSANAAARPEVRRSAMAGQTLFDPKSFDDVSPELREIGYWMMQMKTWDVSKWLEFHAGLTELFDRIAANRTERCGGLGE